MWYVIENYSLLCLSICLSGRPWAYLRRPETPEGDHRETNELKSELVHMSLIETPAGAPETPQQTRDTRGRPAGDQRKARCNYPINYLKFYWHCLSGVICNWELFSNRILVYVSGGILKTEDTSRSTRGDSRLCGGVVTFGDTKGMFVYDLTADFSAIKPCGIVRNK